MTGRKPESLALQQEPQPKEYLPQAPPTLRGQRFLESVDRWKNQHGATPNANEQESLWREVGLPSGREIIVASPTPKALLVI